MLFSKLITRGIRRKFPEVLNVSTETLASWMTFKPESSKSIPYELQGSSVDNNDDQHPGQLVLLDTREAKEVEVSNIPRAFHISPRSTGEEILSKVVQCTADSTEKKVSAVFYCSVGYRASAIAQQLMDHLKRDDITLPKSIEVYNLEGGVFKWANERRPLVDSQNQLTKYVHPFNVVWGKLLYSDIRKLPI